MVQSGFGQVLGQSAGLDRIKFLFGLSLGKVLIQFSFGLVLVTPVVLVLVQITLVSHSRCWTLSHLKTWIHSSPRFSPRFSPELVFGFCTGLLSRVKSWFRPSLVLIQSLVQFQTQFGPTLFFLFFIISLLSPWGKSYLATNHQGASSVFLNLVEETGALGAHVNPGTTQKSPDQPLSPDLV